MPRPEGLPKTGGRIRGTPNRRTGLLVDQLAALGLDVPSEVAKALPNLDAEKRVEVLMELMTFLFPKRKAIEHTVEMDIPPPEIRELTPEQYEVGRLKMIKEFRTLLIVDTQFVREVLEPMCPIIRRTLLGDWDAAKDD
jgi:hypothetical protein